MAKLIRTDGRVENIEPADASKGFTLEECYKHIGCNMIEAFDVGNGEIFIVDENGWLNHSAINEKASNLASKRYRGIVKIVGNVIYCKSEELK